LSCAGAIRRILLLASVKALSPAIVFKGTGRAHRLTTNAANINSRCRGEAVKKRDRENINPTPEAVMAMELWCHHYVAQTGGSMDFWNDLSESGKRRCQDAVARILAAAVCHNRVVVK
jgi:hypothetical protein